MKKFNIEIVLFITVIFIAIGNENVKSQWERFELPNVVAEFNCFAEIGNYAFLGTDKGLFMSTDKGENWNAIDYFKGYPIYELTVNENYLFACVPHELHDYGGIYVSTNYGATWKSLNIGIDKYNYRYDGLQLSVIGNNLFFILEGDFYLSKYDGTSWGKMSKKFFSTKFYWAYSFLACTDNIYLGTTEGLLISSNNGKNWNADKDTLSKLSINALACIGNNIFAGTNKGLYQSTNKGKNWIHVNSSLQISYVNALKIKGNLIFVGTKDGVFRSTNNGTSWTEKSYGFQRGTKVQQIGILGDYVFCKTADRGAESYSSFYFKKLYDDENEDFKLWSVKKKLDWYSSYEYYLRHFPDGLYSKEAQDRLSFLKSRKAVVDVEFPDSSSSFSVTFRETGGEIGYVLEGGELKFFDEYDRKCVFSDDGFTIGAFKVDPGKSISFESKRYGKDYVRLCRNGYFYMEFEGEDAGGNEIRIPVKIDY